MGSRLARTPLLALALLFWIPARAIADEAPVFLIERIVVEGLDRESARQIVLSESRLVEGRSYSEQQLRDAIHRVKRLPFVVDADMSLRKGSERGAYELAIAVVAAKPVAFAIDAGGLYYAPDDDDPLDLGASFTVSARKFVGSRGLLFGSAQAFDDDLGLATLQLGYTRYGLFGAGSYATGAVARAVGDVDAEDNLQASVQVGVPITGNHALRTGVTWTMVEQRFRFFPESSESRFEAWRGDVQWIYDDTDDPLFATTGRRVTGTGVYERHENRFRFVDASGAAASTRADDSSWVVAGEGRQYWSITPKQALGVGGHAERSESFDFSGSSTILAVEAIHAFNLWDFAKRQRSGDLRLETTARVSWSRFASDYFDGDSVDGQLRTSLLFRNAWCVCRLSFTYIDVLRGDR